MAPNYVPDKGDIVWITFDPRAGHEQGGHRPALVLSPASYNGKTGLMVCCAMTSKAKGFPFEVVVSASSVVLADQLRNMDWQARGATKKGTASASVLQAVQQRIQLLIL